MEDPRRCTAPGTAVLGQEKARSLLAELKREQGAGHGPRAGVRRRCRVIPDGGDAARQVFRGDETRLFWRQLPGRTGPSAAEKPDPGLAGARDLLTLLVSSNAAESLKLKPLLVFLAENLRALRAFSKPNLPVLWHSHRGPGSPGASSKSGSGASAPQ